MVAGETLYYNISRTLNELLQNSKKREVVKDKKVYEAIDGALLYGKEAKTPMELTEANEGYKVIYSDRVLIPYIKTSKFYTLDYIRKIRTLILVSFYAYKKKTDKNYDYIKLEADLNGIIKKILQKFSTYNSQIFFSREYEFEISNSVAENYIIQQVFLFLLPFLRPDIVFFLSSLKIDDVKKLIFNYSENLEKIGSILRSSRTTIEKLSKVLVSDRDLIRVLEKYSYCGFYENEINLGLDLLTKTHLLFSTVLRVMYVLKRILKEDYEEFIYRAFYAALISVYNPVFPYIRYIHYKSIKNKDYPIRQIPDFGNLFFFRFINIILSFLKKPELCIEILSGRDYHAFTVLSEKKEKVFNLMNSIFPFDTRVIEILSEEEILRKAENYVRVYTLLNEDVRVEIYEKLLYPYFKHKVIVYEKEYKPEPRQMLMSIIEYEQYSLKSTTNLERWKESFTFNEESDISSAKKYSEKVETILEQGKFSLFQEIDRFKVVRDKIIVCDYVLEKENGEEVVEVEEKTKEDRIVEEKIEEKVEELTSPSQLNLVKEARKILDKTDEIYYLLKTKKEVENMKEQEFDENAIDENVYKELTSILENKRTQKEETAEELLAMVNQKLDLILDILKKKETC